MCKSKTFLPINPSEPLFAAHLPLHRGGLGAVPIFDFVDSLKNGRFCNRPFFVFRYSQPASSDSVLRLRFRRFCTASRTSAPSYSAV